MSYIKKNLLLKEEITYRGRRHWIIFAFSVIFLIIGILFLTKGIPVPTFDVGQSSLTSILNPDIIRQLIQKVAVIPLLLAVMTGMSAATNYLTTEIAVTNMRVLIKIGFIKRTSTEIALKNVASIKISQGIFGRIFNYGTVEICDVGNICVPFRRIAAPIQFRKQVLREINKRSAHQS